MKSNKLTRLLSFFLALVMVCCALPVIAIASTGATSTSLIQSSDNTNTDYVRANPNYQESTEPSVVSELEYLREENVKHFYMSDNTVKAVVYPEAVHRKDANGKWQDIDNTLMTTGISGNYATSDQRVSFAERANSGSRMITIDENGYSISMSFLGNGRISGGLTTERLDAEGVQIINAVSAEIENMMAESMTLTATSIEELPKTNDSRITYRNMLANTDIQYELVRNDVKEYIVVKAPNANGYAYAFMIEVNGLSLTLNADGTVSFNDKDTGEEKYNIPEPYMFDANGKRSDDVYYTLTPAGNDKYIITVRAESEWINDSERAFPVTIDPSVINVTCHSDTFINQLSPSTAYGSSDPLWISSNQISFFKISMPRLPAGAELTNAVLYVAYYYNAGVTTGSLVAGAYQVVNNFAYDSLTWNTAAQQTNMGLSTTQLSRATMSSGAYSASPKWAMFNVKNAAISWVKEGGNYGIALKYVSGTNTSVKMHSLESSTTAYRPYFTINYIIPDVVSGVYKIKNTANNKYLDIHTGGKVAGTAVQQWSATTSNDLNQLFKVTFIGSDDSGLYCYTIRPMCNNMLGLSAPYTSSGNATIESISLKDIYSQIPIKQRWVISQGTSAATIMNGTPSRRGYLATPTSTANGANIITSSSTTNSSWVLEKYTGSEIEVCGFINKVDTMSVNDTFTFTGYMASSIIGQNGPLTYAVSNQGASGACDKATINPSTGYMKALKVGIVWVEMYFKTYPDIKYHPVTIVN